MTLKIYQAKSGAIMLLNGHRVTPLTFAQITDLSLDLYALADFDPANYLAYYAHAV